MQAALRLYANGLRLLNRNRLRISSANWLGTGRPCSRRCFGTGVNDASVATPSCVTKCTPAGLQCSDWLTIRTVNELQLRAGSLQVTGLFSVFASG